MLLYLIPRFVSRVTDCLKIHLGSRNKHGSQTESSKRRRVQTVMVPGLPCPWGHVTTAGACQRETQTPSLRGWGWGVKDGSRLPSPRLLFFQARLRAQYGAENRQSGQEVGRKEKGSKFYYKQNQPHDLQVPVQKEKVGAMVQRVFRRSS